MARGHKRPTSDPKDPMSQGHTARDRVLQEGSPNRSRAQGRMAQGRMAKGGMVTVRARKGAIPKGAIPKGAIPKGVIPKGVIPRGATPRRIGPMGVSRKAGRLPARRPGVRTRRAAASNQNSPVPRGRRSILVRSPPLRRIRRAISLRGNTMVVTSNTRTGNASGSASVGRIPGIRSPSRGKHSRRRVELSGFMDSMPWPPRSSIPRAACAD